MIISNNNGGWFGVGDFFPSASSLSLLLSLLLFTVYLLSPSLPPLRPIIIIMLLRCPTRGPSGFVGFFQPIVDRITLEVPHLVMNSWYLDNGTRCGSMSDIQSALNIIEEEGPSRGLILNRK